MRGRSLTSSPFSLRLQSHLCHSWPQQGKHPFRQQDQRGAGRRRHGGAGMPGWSKRAHPQTQEVEAQPDAGAAHWQPGRPRGESSLLLSSSLVIPEPSGVVSGSCFWWRSVSLFSHWPATHRVRPTRNHTSLVPFLRLLGVFSGFFYLHRPRESHRLLKHPAHHGHVWLTANNWHFQLIRITGGRQQKPEDDRKQCSCLIALSCSLPLVCKTSDVNNLHQKRYACEAWNTFYSSEEDDDQRNTFPWNCWQLGAPDHWTSPTNLGEEPLRCRLQNWK